jgi:protein-L-isoaspartate(D-aspartate) O-methyltransferase
MRVLEVGSGGYIAEIVGPHGTVTSIDIDPDVVARARTGLTRSGHPQVQVIEADGEYGHPGNAPYDAIIVTVEAVDLPPGWTGQLAPGGRLVVPLRLRGNTRSLAFTRRDDQLAATSAILCGFVPMKGAGRHPERRLRLRGDDIVLHIDDDTTTVDVHALAAALDEPRLDVWSPVTTPPGVSFESLLLWLASQPVPFGRLFVDRTRTGDLVAPFAPVSPALLTADSFAYLALNKIDEETWAFGARAFGPHAEPLADTLLDAVAVWDRDHRHGPEPRYTVHPVGWTPADDGRVRLVARRRHATIVVTWPAAGTVAS